MESRRGWPMPIKGLWLVLASLMCGVPFSRADLYNKSDPIVLLTTRNFNKTLFNAPNAWIIEFYSSWCGHCQNYAPTWREFSYQVIDWDHTIKVAVLDCSDEENGSTCRDYEVASYPTIRLFGAFVQSGDLGRPVSQREVGGLQRAIVNFLSREQKHNNAPDTWVNLRKYNGAVDKIFRSAPPSAKHSVLIVEEPKSLIGSYVIFDLGNYPMIYVRIVENGASHHLNSFTFASLPAVIIVDREGNVDVLRETGTTREELTALIIHRLNLRKQGFPSTSPPTNVTASTIRPTTRPSSRKDKVFMVDIENAVAYALRQEVSLQNEITGEALDSLKLFIDVLLRYLPTRPKVNQFLVDLNDYLKEKYSLTGVEFDTALNTLESPTSALPRQQPWIGCLGSESKYRGYPCGLWTTFHTLTVNAVLRDGHNPTYSALEVMGAIHSYVKYFFGCEHCSTHFQDMYAVDAESFVQKPNDEIVWLWKSHNKVNKRLKSDLTEDPQHPKVVFPIPEKCAVCYLRDGSFNIPKVINYLKMIYEEDAISLEGVDDFSAGGLNGTSALAQNNAKSPILNEVTFYPIIISLLIFLSLLN